MAENNYHLSLGRPPVVHKLSLWNHPPDNLSLHHDFDVGVLYDATHDLDVEGVACILSLCLDCHRNSTVLFYYYAIAVNSIGYNLDCAAISSDISTILTMTFHGKKKVVIHSTQLL